jgi:hypothetical protein
LCATQRTTRARAQCYELAVKRWIIAAALAIAGGVIVIVMLTRSDEPRRPPATIAADATVEHFRSVERQSIATFNAALRRQRANEIDELELSLVIERDVLDPWRAMRARVAAAPVPAPSRELYEVMNRYIAERELAWQAYALALQARSDAEARPHYDVYHQKNAEAQSDAQLLGGLFRHQR